LSLKKHGALESKVSKRRLSEVEKKNSELKEAISLMLQQSRKSTEQASSNQQKRGRR
jgi:hypothetical protein